MCSLKPKITLPVNQNSPWGKINLEKAYYFYILKSTIIIIRTFVEQSFIAALRNKSEFLSCIFKKTKQFTTESR